MTLIDELRPDDLAEKYRSLGNAHSQIAWMVGDLVQSECEGLDILKRKGANGELVGWSPARVTQLFQTGYMDVYKSVAALTGKTERRIRQYRETSIFYPLEIREAFSPLPHSHFEFAMRFGCQWRDVLELALRQTDLMGGRCPSVDWLEMNFRGVNDIAPTNDSITLAEAPQDLGSILYDVKEQERTPAQQDALPVDAGTALMLSRLAETVKVMRQIAAHLSLPGDGAKRLQERVEALRAELEQVGREILENA